MVARAGDEAFRRRVAHRLWTARTRRSLSKAELARRSGVGESTIAQAEAATNVPQLDTAALLADALHISLDWLTGRSNTPDLEHTGRFGAGSMPPPDDPAAHTARTAAAGKGGGVLDPLNETARVLTHAGGIQNSA
jgi:transcriptional regulator with XRE-family HTH domain